MGVSGRFHAPKAPRILQSGGRLGVTTERKLCKQILMLLRPSINKENTNRKTSSFVMVKIYIMLKFSAFVGIT